MTALELVPLFELDSPVDGVRSHDVVSACGRYRYRLDREWAPGLGRVCWIMLNPSKALRDATDRTDTRVHGFTRGWGYGAYSIVNLHGWRATDPAELVTAEDPVGPANDQHVTAAIAGAALIVAAWGASYPNGSRPLVQRTASMLRAAGAHVLGLTAGGAPSHPLYLRASTSPVPWEDCCEDGPGAPAHEISIAPEGWPA